MSLPGTFGLFESSTGARIHRLPLEVFPGFWAYAYLVQKDDYVLLVDSGSGTDSSHAHLLDGMRRAGVAPTALTHILLTHAHIDHYGGLTRLRPLTGAKIAIHELDVHTVAHHKASLALFSLRLNSFLAGSGLAYEAREQVLAVYGFTKSLYRSVAVDVSLGSSIDLRDRQLGPLEFIHLPGHCPGHIAIRLDDVVFCGDMVVQGVTPHLSPESVSSYNGLNHYLESLGRFQEWAQSARLIFNGHDEVITDLPAQVAAAHQNILRRMNHTIEVLSQPLTIEEVCQAVYGQTSGYNQLLVMEKTGAYVEYLYEHALIGITNAAELEQGLPARYQRLREKDEMLAEVTSRIQRHEYTRR